jgi:hypothetical protein
MPSSDPEKVLYSLKSFQELNTIKTNKDFKDPAKFEEYIKIVFQPNAAIEVAEQSLRTLLNENMRSKLPADMPEEKKDEYINGELMDIMKAGFNDCIKGPKNISGYDNSKGYKNYFENRKWMKDTFCKENKNICDQVQKPGCPTSDATINLLTMSPESNDTDVVKSCAMNGLARVIKPLFSLTLTTQVESFKKDVNLPPDLAERFSDKAWKNFTGCINGNPLLKDKAKPTDGNPSIYLANEKTNPLIFRRMSTDDFKRLYYSCVSKIEEELTRDFIEIVFISNENVTQTYQSDSMGNFHGFEYPTAAIDYTKKTVQKNIDLCFENQKKYNTDRPDFKPDPTICTPILEVDFARTLVEQKITTMLGNLTKEKETKTMLENYKVCTQKAYDEITLAAGNPNGTPPLSTPEEAKDYLDNNKSFFNCVATAMVETSKILAANEYQQSLLAQKKQLKNYSQLYGMTKDVAEEVGKCFKDEISKVGSWPKFKEFNNIDGITMVKEKCTMVAKKYSIPRIMLTESKSKLQGLLKDGYLSKDEEMAQIILEGTQDIKSTLGLQIDPSLKGEKYLLAVYAAGVESYLRKYPQTGQDKFIKLFEEKVTKRAIDKIKGKLLSKIKDNAMKRFGLNLSDLDAALPTTCVSDLYKNLVENKPQSSQSSNTSPINFDEITTQLVDGFNYLNKLPPPALKNQMDKISTFCKNSSKYKTLEDMKASGVADFLVKAQIHQKTIAALKKAADDTRRAEHKQYNRDPGYTNIAAFINKKHYDSTYLIDQLLANPARFEQIIFPQGKNEIINFALTNLDTATQEGHADSSKLTSLVMNQLFSDRSKASFASKFAEIQIVNNVGISGFGMAREDVRNTIQNDPMYRRAISTIYRNAIGALENNWTITKVHSRFAWSELPSSMREDLVENFFQHGIVPATNGSSPTEVQREKQIVTDQVTRLLDSRRLPDGRTFTATFRDEILSETKENTSTTEATLEWIFD